MSADQLRNRTVGSKMTESEYEQLVAVAERDGLTLGEWCREVLLAQANTTEETRLIATEQTLLAEVMALRTILLNALFKLAQGGSADNRGTGPADRAGRWRAIRESAGTICGSPNRRQVVKQQWGRNS